MFKHIIGQALFQVIILITLLFTGEYIIPEFADDYDTSDGFQTSYKYTETGMARSGRMIYIDGTDDYQSIYDTTSVYSRHFTFIFNVFVMMQVFNFVNSRKIYDEINIFENITVNWLFPAIVLIILVLQIILVTFAGFAFGVYSYFGLHPAHWGMSVIFILI